MPNFFNYFALVLFFIVVSPISPTALGPTTYLYIHISICIYVLVSVPTLYINSMIKQKSKTFIIFFTIFFIGQYLHCNNTFLFWQKQIISNIFCFYNYFFMAI